MSDISAIHEFIKKTAEIFKKQISHERVNYSPMIANYFKLYFAKYADTDFSGKAC